MNKDKQNPLNLFILIAGGVLTIQLTLASSSVRPIVFEDIGILSTDMVLAIFSMVITLCLFLVGLSLLSLLADVMPNIDLSRFHLLPLAAGAELIVLGLASINLSRYVVSGTAASIMPIGVELFSMGMISIAIFVQDMGPSCVVKGLPNHAFLLFFISLLPMAFLITI